jgi:hypothetical protein
MAWIIRNTDDPTLFWSHHHGWVEVGADSFSDHERKILRLPMGGEWEATPKMSVEIALRIIQALATNAAPVMMGAQQNEALGIFKKVVSNADKIAVLLND